VGSVGGPERPDSIRCLEQFQAVLEQDGADDGFALSSTGSLLFLDKVPHTKDELAWERVGKRTWIVESFPETSSVCQG
jgi:hypothetical protein